jgi:hypothetical protein
VFKTARWRVKKAIREEIRYEFPPVSFCSGSFLGGRGCAEADEEAAHKATAVY